MMGLGMLSAGRLGVIGSILSFEPIDGLGDLSDGVYWDTATGDLRGARGGTWSNVRASASTEVDFEGLVRDILSGEARFEKLRRVENLQTFSEAPLSSGTTANSGWTGTTGGTGTLPTLQADGYIKLDRGASDTASDFSRLSFAVTGVPTTTGRGYTARVEITAQAACTISTLMQNGSGAQTWTFTAGETKILSWTKSTEWASQNNRIQILGGASNSQTAFIRIKAQFEDITGQSNQNPSEYVSKGVLSTPYHGAGVDGVRYFNTANGNTVASNVVTEAAGAALDTDTLQSGIDPYGSHKNCVIQSEDWNTTWVAAGTPVVTAASQRCGAVVLSTVEDNSALAVEGHTQAITFTGNSTKSVLVYIKKGTATSSVIRLRDTTAGANRLLAAITWTGSVPTVTMTTGTLVGSQALADGVYRINMSATSVTAANTNSLEFYPATDAALDVLQTGTIIWGGVMATDAVIGTVPYRKTTTAAVTVAADVITLSGSGIINATEGTLWAQWIATATPAAQAIVFSLNDGTSNEDHNVQHATDGNVYGESRDGSVGQAAPQTGAPVAGVAQKVAYRYRLNDFAASRNGAAAVTDVSGTVPTTTTIQVGGRVSSSPTNTVIKRIAYSRTGASDANLAVSTT